MTVIGRPVTSEDLKFAQISTSNYTKFIYNEWFWFFFIVKKIFEKSLKNREIIVIIIFI